MFKVGEFVKIRTLDGVPRPCTGNGYRYKITRVKRFLWFRFYDLKSIYPIGSSISQKLVPEKELAKWWECV